MSIDKFSRLIPPPDNDSTANWPLVEGRLGTKLPSEYKRIIDLYGLGTFGGIMTLFSPLAKRRHLNLVAHHDMVQVKFETYSTIFDLPVYPHAGGLLAFGTFENWEMFYWLTEGEPDEWPILINEQRGPEFNRYELPLSVFMVRLLRQELKTTVLADYSSIITSEFEPIVWPDEA